MSGTHLARLTGYLSGRPLYMESGHAKVAFDAVAGRLGLSADSDGGDGQSFADAKRQAMARRMAAVVEAETVEVGDEMGEYALTAEGIAIVCVSGMLVSRFDWMAAMCGLTSYDSLGLTLDAAVADQRVRAILLDIDSPGGEASGMLDVADRIRALSARKPIWASANSLAASAAYGIAAACSRITVPRLGAVGSVGVVAVHVDQSAADGERGLKFTPLYSGARKIDGWGHAALSEEARATFQAQLDEARLKFATSVAGFRGLSVDAVLATEAGVYDDDAAVAAGLADAMEPFAATLAALTNRSRPAPLSSQRGPAARSTAKQEIRMAKDSKAADPMPADEDTEAQIEGEPEDEEAEAKPDAASDRAAAAEIATMCADAGVPRMAAGLIRDGATVAQSKARIDSAGKIRAAVERAHRINASAVPMAMADDLIAAGATVETAKAACMDRLCAGQSPEIGSQVEANATLDRKEVAAGWDHAVAKVNATAGFRSK